MRSLKATLKRQAAFRFDEGEGFIAPKRGIWTAIHTNKYHSAKTDRILSRLRGILPTKKEVNDYLSKAKRLYPNLPWKQLWDDKVQSIFGSIILLENLVTEDYMTAQALAGVLLTVNYENVWEYVINDSLNVLLWEEIKMMKSGTEELYLHIPFKPLCLHGGPRRAKLYVDLQRSNSLFNQKQYLMANNLETAVEIIFDSV